MKSVSCPGSYCGLVLGCGHWLELEALEGQAGLVDPSLREGLEDHGGLRERNDRNITVGTDILYFRGMSYDHNISSGETHHNSRLVIINEGDAMIGG